MTRDIRLVTCAQLPADDPDTPLIATTLAAHGLRVATDDWRDRDVDWGDAPVTIVRSPWDYVDAVDDFITWARATNEVTDLWNPAALLEWNVHKSYLLALDALGAPIVPTVMLLTGSAASLDGICDARGWNRVVVKPAVAIGAHGAARFDVGDEQGQRHLDALLERGDVLVQPFLRSVNDGELSVILFDGRVSHAVVKRPAADDFRVQEQWGGYAELATPSDAAADLATRVCEVLPTPTLYARVDLLRVGTQWHVLEVEVTEPSLWLELAPAASLERLVTGICERLA